MRLHFSLIHQLYLAFIFSVGNHPPSPRIYILHCSDSHWNGASQLSFFFFSFSGNRPCDNCSIAGWQNAQCSYNPPLQLQNILLQAGQSPPLVVINIRLDSLLPPLRIWSIFFFRKSLSAKCLYQNVLSACPTLLLRLVIRYGWGEVTFSTKTKEMPFLSVFQILALPLASTASTSISITHPFLSQRLKVYFLLASFSSETSIL